MTTDQMTAAELVELYGPGRGAKIARLEARLAERDAEVDRLRVAYEELATSARFESDEAYDAYSGAGAAWMQALQLRNRTSRALLRAL